MGDEDRARFVRELLECVRSLPATGIPSWTEEVNEYALRVRTRLIELSEVLDTRSLNYYEHATEYVKQLEKKLEDAMSTRRNARAGGLAGNAMRVGGTLAYAHPVGKAVFWIGLAVSTGCDIFAEFEGRDIQALSGEINRILDRSKDSFRPVAGAIRRLDELLLERTGYSLYDEEFQHFLRDAEVQAVDAVPCSVDNVERRNNLVELARNREYLKLLQEIVQAICKEDVLFFTVVSQGLFGIGCFNPSLSINESAAFQVGELCSRGLAMFFEYKHDRITLQRFANEIWRMDKQLKAMKDVCPYLT